jgi:chromosome partitioning protein
MVIAIASTKGGVGKSTLAMQFLHCMALRSGSKKVMIFDADPQGTCLGWSRKRAEYGLPYLEVQSMVATGMGAILKSKKEEYDLIFIDVGGTDNKALRAALVLVDVVIVPTWQDPTVREHTFDMMELIHEARELNPELRSFVVFNFTRHTKERNAVEEFKTGFPPYIMWVKQMIDQRKILSRVYPFGKTVYDIGDAEKGGVERDESLAAAKARADIDGVLNEIEATLGGA